MSYRGLARTQAALNQSSGIQFETHVQEHRPCVRISPLTACKNGWVNMFDLKDLEETAYFYLELQIKERRHVTGLQLAAALKANRGQEIPNVLFDYLCRFLEGKVRKRPGPTRKEGLREISKWIMAQCEYQNYLEEERLNQKRERSSRHSIRRAASSPHEVAARKVRDRFYPHVDYRHVLNL